MWVLFLKIFLEVINWGVILFLLAVIVVLVLIVYLQKGTTTGLEETKKTQDREIRRIERESKLKDRQIVFLAGKISRHD